MLGSAVFPGCSIPATGPSCRPRAISSASWISGVPALTIKMMRRLLSVFGGIAKSGQRTIPRIHACVPMPAAGWSRAIPWGWGSGSARSRGMDVLKFAQIKNGRPKRRPCRGVPTVRGIGRLRIRSKSGTRCWTVCAALFPCRYYSVLP